MNWEKSIETLKNMLLGVLAGVLITTLVVLFTVFVVDQLWWMLQLPQHCKH